MGEALRTIAASGVMMACVCDERGALLAILTDSDVRKALITGAQLTDPVSKWANSNPTVLRTTHTTPEIFAQARETGKRELPILDEQGRLVDIFVLGIYETRGYSSREEPCTPFAASAPIDNAAFVLAGGLGTRLRSIVPDKPKPLAMVKDKTLIQILFENLIANGFRKFFVSVNYMGDMIEDHLASHFHRHDIEIEYVRETQRLGTAGSLGYVTDKVKKPLLVCNADVLTTAPYNLILRNHESAGADATCVTREHRVSVPYGVLQIEGDEISSIREKPEMRFLVNAGIYVLSPSILKLISGIGYLDMPELMNQATREGFRVLPFYLHEYWLDVGRPEDFNRANQEWNDFAPNP